MAKDAAMKSIGAIEVLGTLGEGAHSTILHVRRKTDGKAYALKIVPIANKNERKYLDQAEYEYQIAQKLDHANLIKIFALEKKRTLTLRVREVRLLIEYVDGKTLDTYKRIPLPQLVQIFCRVAAGLAHMHRRGVYHADLKPNNIILSRSGQVKIIDYGLAWLKGQDKGRVQGTPEYMAPEQIKKRLVNEKTDIFNFGATMYRLVTWRNVPASAAMAGMVNAQTWKSLLKPVREFNPEAPKELAELIQSCLAYKPAERPEQVGDVKQVLDELAKKLGRAR